MNRLKFLLNFKLKDLMLIQRNKDNIYIKKPLFIRVSFFMVYNKFLGSFLKMASVFVLINLTTNLAYGKIELKKCF